MMPAGGNTQGGLDLQLEVQIETTRSNGDAMRLSRSSSRHSYWSLAQMLTHHTENGCNLRPGDLLATGTQSGPTDGEKGCLMELSHNGRVPIRLSNGETRAMLARPASTNADIRWPKASVIPLFTGDAGAIMQSSSTFQTINASGSASFRSTA